MPAGATGPFDEREDADNAGWTNLGVPGGAPVAAPVPPAQVRAGAREAGAGRRTKRSALCATTTTPPSTSRPKSDGLRAKLVQSLHGVAG